MCSFLCLLICCGFPLRTPTYCKELHGQSTGQMTAVPFSPPLAGSYCQRSPYSQVTVHSFSNTLLLRPLCCQDNTPSPPPSFPAFSQSHKALKENENKSPEKRSLWCQNCQLLLSPEDEPGYTAKRKTNPPKWGKGRRIIMFPNQKFK